MATASAASHEPEPAAVAAVPRLPLSIPGRIGPAEHPDSHGFRPGDAHLILDDRNETLAAFTYSGGKLWTVPALGRGQLSDREWKAQWSDTPPGLWRFGTAYADFVQDPSRCFSRERAAYGWWSVELLPVCAMARSSTRRGLMLHGGGSELGWPGAWAPFQPLVPTLGCIRVHNQDAERRIRPLREKGAVFVSVYQEA